MNSLEFFKVVSLFSCQSSLSLTRLCYNSKCFFKCQHLFQKIIFSIQLFNSLFIFKSYYPSTSFIFILSTCLFAVLPTKREDTISSPSSSIKLFDLFKCICLYNNSVITVISFSTDCRKHFANTESFRTFYCLV